MDAPSPLCMGGLVPGPPKHYTHPASVGTVEKAYHRTAAVLRAEKSGCC